MDKRAADGGGSAFTGIAMVVLAIIAVGLPLWHFGGFGERVIDTLAPTSQPVVATAPASEPAAPAPPQPAPEPIIVEVPVVLPPGGIAWAAPVPTLTRVTSVVTHSDGQNERVCAYVELERGVAGVRNFPPSPLWSGLDTDLSWRPTPAPTEVFRQAAFPCVRVWPTSVNPDVLRALQNSGSWYAVLPNSQIVLVYSLPEGIATYSRDFR